MHLVALTQATQDGDGVLHARLLNHNGLETTLQRAVLFNIFAIFVQGSCTNAAQLATGQHGLQDIARVHSTLGSASAHYGVQLIDEHNNLSGTVAHSLQHLFQTLLKFTTEFGTGNQRCQIQSIKSFVLQAFGHIASHNTAGKALGDSGFTNARFANKHRVILFTAAQDFDNATNFLVTPDNRVQLALLGLSSQILTIFFQGLFGFLIRSSILVLHPCGFNLLFIDAIFTQQ